MAERGEAGVTHFPDVSIVIPATSQRSSPPSRPASARTTPGALEIVVIGMSTNGTRQVTEELAATGTRLRMVDNPSRITPGA